MFTDFRARDSREVFRTYVGHRLVQASCDVLSASGNEELTNSGISCDFDGDYNSRNGNTTSRILDLNMKLGI